MSRQASGLMAWLVQRVTSVYLAAFLVYVLLHFVFDPPADHTELRSWVSHPWIALGLLLLVPILLAHAWVGVRDMLMDYVRPLWARLTMLSLFALIFLASGLWAFKAIIGASLVADIPA